MEHASTPADRWNLLDAECHRLLDLPASDFLQRLDAGYYANPALPLALREKARYLATLLPYQNEDLA